MSKQQERIVNFLVAIAIAITSSIATVVVSDRFKDMREREYTADIIRSIKIEALQNARRIRSDLPELARVASDLEKFVVTKGTSLPGVEPGYGTLTTGSLQSSVSDPTVTRHLLPCARTLLFVFRDRLDQAARARTEAHTALVDYTGTAPGPISDSHVAAARLHARIEQLIVAYTDLPDGLEILVNQALDVQSCDELIEVPSSWGN